MNLMNLVPNPLDFSQVSDAFEEIASGGDVWTQTYNTGAPATSSAVTAQEQQAATANDILSQAGIASGSSVMNEDQILDVFHAAGVDVSNPAVQQAAQTFASTYNDPTQQSNYVNLLASSFAKQYPRPMSNYQEAIQSYHLQDIQFDRPTPDTTTEVSGIVGMNKEAYLTGESPAPAKTPKGKDVVFHNGVWYYRNGVIADPSQNALAFPNKNQESIPGSPVWLSNAYRTWSTEKVEAWRKELHRLGYDVKQRGGWDKPLQDATKAYYLSKYTNGGEVVPYSSHPGGGSGTGSGSPPLDLHQLTASIQSQVQQQYQSVFGQDPTPDELKTWTNFVINTGMQLQQGGARMSLSPDAALSEAEARAARRITNSPEGSAAVEHAQENTSLHDALTSAIVATRF